MLAGFSEFLEAYFPKVSDPKEFAENKILDIKDCIEGSVDVNLYNRGFTFCYRYKGSTYTVTIFVPMYSIDTDYDSIELERDQGGLIELFGSYSSEYNDFTVSLDKRSLYLSMSSKLSILLSSAYEVDISDGLRLFISEGYTVSLREIYEYCFYILKGDTIIYCFILNSYDKAIDEVKKDDVVITELDNEYNFDIKIHLDGKDRDLLFSIDKVINKDSFDLIDIRYKR